MNARRVCRAAFAAVLALFVLSPALPGFAAETQAASNGTAAAPSLSPIETKAGPAEAAAETDLPLEGEEPGSAENTVFTVRIVPGMQVYLQPVVWQTPELVDSGVKDISLPKGKDVAARLIPHLRKALSEKGFKVTAPFIDPAPLPKELAPAPSGPVPLLPPDEGQIPVDESMEYSAAPKEGEKSFPGLPPADPAQRPAPDASGGKKIPADALRLAVTVYDFSVEPIHLYTAGGRERMTSRASIRLWAGSAGPGQDGLFSHDVAAAQSAEGPASDLEETRARLQLRALDRLSADAAEQIARALAAEAGANAPEGHPGAAEQTVPHHDPKAPDRAQYQDSPGKRLKK